MEVPRPAGRSADQCPQICADAPLEAPAGAATADAAATGSRATETRTAFLDRSARNGGTSARLPAVRGSHMPTILFGQPASGQGEPSPAEVVTQSSTGTCMCSPAILATASSMSVQRRRSLTRRTPDGAPVADSHISGRRRRFLPDGPGARGGVAVSGRHPSPTPGPGRLLRPTCPSWRFGPSSAWRACWSPRSLQPRSDTAITGMAVLPADAGRASPGDTRISRLLSLARAAGCWISRQGRWCSCGCRRRWPQRPRSCSTARDHPRAQQAPERADPGRRDRRAGPRYHWIAPSARPDHLRPARLGAALPAAAADPAQRRQPAVAACGTAGGQLLDTDLVAFLIFAVVLGLVAVGPRQPLRSAWVCGGGAVAMGLSAPYIA